MTIKNWKLVIKSEIVIIMNDFLFQLHYYFEYIRFIEKKNA